MLINFPLHHSTDFYDSAYKLYTRSKKQDIQSSAMNDDSEKVQWKPGATPPDSADSFKRIFSKKVTVHFVGAWYASFVSVFSVISVTFQGKQCRLLGQSDAKLCPVRPIV